MLFKNLVFSRLPKEWNLSAADLEDQLARRPLRACGPFDMSTKGWVTVTHGGRLLHSLADQQLIALGTDDKLLPGSIIQQIARERADVQAEVQGFPVGRKQMRDLKMKVADELRARALSRRRVTRAWIDNANGWFVVDAASPARAELLVETLHDSLGSFVPVGIDTARSPHVAMTSWLLRGDVPARFSIEDELELQSADKSKTVIRYVRHPLDGKEIRTHLLAGKYPTRLRLTWNDRLSFVLTDKLQLKRLDFLELRQDDVEREEVDPAEQFDIDFAVMAGELGAMLSELAALFAVPVDMDWREQTKVA